MEKLNVTLIAQTPIFIWKGKKHLGKKNRKEFNKKRKENKIVIYDKYLRKVEFSANAFKGLIRWWFRAFLGYSDELFKIESELFGSNDKASSIKIKINNIDPIVKIWDENFHREIKDKKYSYGKYRYSKGSGNYNGLLYFGYNFHTKSKKNKEIIDSEYFAPGTKIEITFIVQNKNILNIILMIFWLLLQFGGVGSRSRRGFGNLTIDKNSQKKINIDDGYFEFRNSYSDINDYINVLTNNLTILKSIFPLKQKIKINNFTNLSEFSLFLKEPGIPKKEVNNNTNNSLSEKLKGTGFANGVDDWKVAINYAGATMQYFRALKEPDYSNVHNYNTLTKLQRPAFGMPLEFRFSDKDTPNFLVAPMNKNNERNEDKFTRLASPVIVSTTEINGKIYVQYLFLSFDYKFDYVDIEIKAKQNKIIKDVEIDSSILTEFSNFLKNPGKELEQFKYQEIKI